MQLLNNAFSKLTRRIVSQFLLVSVIFISSAVAAEPAELAKNDTVILEQESLNSLQDDSAINLLNKMRDAVLNKDYQVYFLQHDIDEYPQTFKYQHLGANENKNSSANLLYLEGPAKEIILHDNITSYFQPDSTSFSISSSRIIEAIPDVVYNDFSKLANYYDFIVLGKARTANRSSQLVRVVSKDKDRYNYQIWIDDETLLPLRISLFDFEYRLIQQFKVLQLDLDFDKTAFADYINDRDYPILLAMDKQNNPVTDWQLNWLPNGFTEQASYNIIFYDSDIDTRLFSDGIFSFTVNISQKSTDKGIHVIQQGARTIYSTNVATKNIVIIGNLPQKTIEHIAQNIVIKQ